MTYPKVKIDRAQVLDQLKKKLEPRQISEYVISTEHHVDGDEHVHAYIKLDSRCNIRDKGRLDLEIGEEKAHGNYQTCRNYMSVVSYIMKEGRDQVLTNKDLDDRGRERNRWREIYEKIKEGQEVNQVLEDIAEIAPRLVVTDYTKIRRSIADIKQGQIKTKQMLYALKSFNEIDGVKEYREKLINKKTLYLSGATGTGKTEFTKALYAAEVGEANVLRITEKEGLVKLKEKAYKALIMDDIDMGKMSGEQVINLTDLANENTIRILYGTVDIPARLPRAIISNKRIDEMFKGVGAKQLEAIIRRCHNVDIKGKTLRIKLEMELTEKKEEEGGNAEGQKKKDPVSPQA